jgi:hypothetical protein
MKYTVTGFIELHGVPKEILDKLKEGDSVQDNDGKSRVVTVNACDICGKKLFSAMRFFVPVYCDECS